MPHSTLTPVTVDAHEPEVREAVVQRIVVLVIDFQTFRERLQAQSLQHDTLRRVPCCVVFTMQEL